MSVSYFVVNTSTTSDYSHQIPCESHSIKMSCCSHDITSCFSNLLIWETKWIASGSAAYAAPCVVMNMIRPFKSVVWHCSAIQFTANVDNVLSCWHFRKHLLQYGGCSVVYKISKYGLLRKCAKNTFLLILYPSKTRWEKQQRQETSLWNCWNK